MTTHSVGENRSKESARAARRAADLFVCPGVSRLSLAKVSALRLWIDPALLVESFLEMKFADKLKRRESREIWSAN